MKHKLLPPTYFYTFIVISIVLHFISPLRQVVFSPWFYLGFLPIIFGIFLNIWADKLFKQHKTTENPFKPPSSLVISGPFKISRHPMYLGMFFVLLGIAIILGSIISFTFPITFVILMEMMFIPFEEEQMEKNFKKEYTSYKKKVRRWV